jgi:hypothetical protein
MKKIFMHSIAFIILGNTIITIGEKTCFSKFDLTVLQQNFFTTKNDTDFIAQFPATLLLTKMLVWITAFSIISLVLHFIKIKHKKKIKTVIMSFYILSCLANVLIVPHPIWFIVGVFPICIVPFILIENILLTIKKAIELARITKTIENESWNLR